MFESLRTRFVLSHALPVLILLPLLSFILLYLLETRYLMVNLANEMQVQAILVGDILRSDPAVWNDTEVATARVEQIQQRLEHQLPQRIMLIDVDGTVVASTLPADAPRIGRTVQDELDKRALSGQVAWDLVYSLGLGERIVDVAVPVMGDDGRPIGVVRISHPLAQMQERLAPVRWFVLGTFATGILVAVAVSFALAGSMSRSLMRLAEAVTHFTAGSPPEQLRVSGSREMKILISQYNRMARQLYELELARRRLLAGIVHEIGRPLGGINAAAQLLSRREQPEPDLVHELAGEIESAVQDIRLEIDDLALLAQTDRGDIQLHLQKVNLEELFIARCAHIAGRIRKDGLQLETHFAPDLPEIDADPLRVAQILCNLMDNARKYASAGGWIRVDATLEQSGDEAPFVAFRVTDTGPGIPPEEQEKIFQFFYRSPDQGPVKDGMGIGLALGRQLAEAHGGTLFVESAPEQGAVFTLRLPVHAPRS